MYDDLIRKLENLNFNNIESKVYIMLVKYNELNGSQIAKKLNISRSSVYSALNNLSNKGVVYLVPGDTNTYKAENTETLVDNMKSNFEENIRNLKDELLKIQDKSEENRYYNLNGDKNFLSKAKEFLIMAEREVYINTCIDLQVFKEEIHMLAEKGVRVIVFTYNEINSDGLPIELYKHPLDEKVYEEEQEIRFMMAVDLKNTLICSGIKGKIEMNGTFTKDKLLARIVAEHIHHDIYLLKLKQKDNKEIIDDEIRLHTLLDSTNLLDYK